MSGPVFIDTSGWLALGYRLDPIHEPASRFYREIRSRRTPVFTSDYVLDELISTVFAREVTNDGLRFVKAVLFAAIRGYLITERITPERIMAALELPQRLDRPEAPLTDFTTMVVMRERGIKRILTRDAQFATAGMDIELVP